MTNIEHRAAARQVSTISIILGLLVPILPRLVVPVVRPGRYVDTFHRVFLERPLDTPKLVVWTALPFLVLAWLSYRGLSRAPVERFRFRYATLLTIALVMFVAGFVIHIPLKPGMGFNFGVAFFPFYAAILAGLTFGALVFARGIWRLLARSVL